jgi:Carboxypeptidase regulatory-like domain
MKQLCAATLILVLAGIVANPQERVNGGSVGGIVLCEDTKAPARGAYVWLQKPRGNQPGVFVPPAEAFGATTGIDGSFAISDVVPGEYYIIATYPGYISAQEYIFPGSLSPEVSGSHEPLPPFVQRVSIAPGAAVNAEVRLKKGGTISGSVAYSDGAPVPYAALTPLIKINGDFGRVLNLAHADSSGKYRIEGLPEGSYAVVGAIGSGEMVTVFGGGKIGSSGLMTFAGGGMRPGKARVVVVTPNENAGVNVTIPLTGLHEVTGTVTAPDGHRLNHGFVRLYPTGERVSSLVTPLTPDGTFSFHSLPADHFTISVEEASDFNMTTREDGILRYQQPTLVQRYGPGSVEIIVMDRDLTNVSLTVSAIR